MKKIKVIALVLAMVMLLAACGQAKTSNGKTGIRASEKPFVKVGDTEVSNKEYYEQYDLFAAVYALNQGLNQNISNMIISDTFIAKDLADKKVEITEEEYQKEFDAAIKQMGGTAEFEKYLDFMGTTEEVFRNNIKNNYNNTKHLEWFKSTFEPADEELNAYYEQNKTMLDYTEARHILVKDESVAKEVAEKLKAGEKSFEELSNEYSIDEAAKASGGSLGRITPARASEYDADFIKALFALDKNEVSEPVKTQFGYHIIEVTAKAQGMENHKDNIVEALASQKHQEYLNENIQKLDVVFYDGNGLPIVNGENPETNEQTEGTEEPTDNE